VQVTADPYADVATKVACRRMAVSQKMGLTAKKNGKDNFYTLDRREG
jgi:hypothetical protein